MKTSEFVQLIAEHPTKLLRFLDHQKTVVHPSYHVSEVKTATFETVDCGGMAHHWKETIFQLWLSDDPDSERAMATGKVTGILEKVSKLIAVDLDTELRIEYGNEEFPPVVFHIDKIAVETDAVVVSLRPPVLQCKLEERGSSCARPEEAPADAKEESGSCCSGTKCC
ncbi:hypothetical protein SAMN05444156_0657 [Verrucomicrobium sp. GAS474]|uniref:DUF6428 family protein n=1 Tax=Verrucomicrobium sp. GAS474 TaxID=1882831 RepID=UPI00087996FC|nr:DUF6428 family protein [Verrucomicrobium sp. GAS474]SDT91033.1 hypothetical protein SAMN05444156_0657 [Verrucomicrobium sp. GAS474]